MHDVAREMRENLERPLPQVGALLDLDTSLDVEDRAFGHKDWILRGSCVLVAPDRVLTIQHLLGGFGRAAAFFPGFGIFPLERVPGVASGDPVACVGLERAVPGLPPLPHLQIETRRKYDGRCDVCGYGRWIGVEDGGLDGLQRRATVGLGPPKGSGRHGDWPHYDSLDLSWSSKLNGGLQAGRGNSGGPLLWERDGWRVVGVNRESFGDQQAGSWIDQGDASWCPEEPAGGRQAIDLECRLLDLGLEPIRADFAAPAGARRAHATLNGSAGRRWQMGLATGASTACLADLGDDDRASGRFLYRSLDLDGARAVTVGVAPVKTARVEASRVLAQLCVRFE